ncbi:MAG: hypothetical protein ACKVX7_15975 [Planctomycetota bacterium]
MPSISELPANCPRCGSDLETEGKNTHTGVETWVYSCVGGCGWNETYEGGIALWKAMSAAEDEATRDSHAP